MKRSSSIIPKFLIILTISSVAAGLFILSKNWDIKASKKITQDIEGFNTLTPKIIGSVEDFWINAGLNFKMDQLLCPELILPDPKVGSKYLSCNPLFWECFWSSGIKKKPSLQVEYEGQVFTIEAVKNSTGSFGSVITNSSLKNGEAPSWAYQVELKVKEFPEFSLNMALLDSCNDLFLPERVYAYGVSQTSRAQDVFLWDNFGREIYLDKFPVANYKINLWAAEDKKFSHLIKEDVSLFPFPATHLSRAEQIKYCASVGKRLMEPHLFDAASMIPSGDEKFPEVIAPASTPWERDRARTFLMSDKKPSVEDCQKAPVKGCDQYAYNTNSASWMGISDTLGSYPESFRAVYDRMNVKISSVFIEKSSPWNSLGKRGIWSGEGSSSSDFSTGSLDENPFLSMEEVPVGFRCYLEVVR